MPKKIINSSDIPKGKILTGGKVALFQGFYYYLIGSQWIRDYKA